MNARISHRLVRADAHVGEAALPGQSVDQQLGEALADLRMWARKNGASYRLADDIGYVQTIRDRVLGKE